MKVRELRDALNKIDNHSELELWFNDVDGKRIELELTEMTATGMWQKSRDKAEGVLNGLPLTVELIFEQKTDEKA
jgi:hypothetical protein